MNRQVAWLAFALPIVPPALVVCVRFIGHAPSAAEAEVTTHYQGDEFAELERLAGVALAGENGARAWEASGSTLGESWRGVTGGETPRDPVVVTDPGGNPDVEEVRTPALMLTTIFDGGGGVGGGGAVLGGRIYRVGDTIDNGWVLESVDRTGRSVTIRHTTGASGTIRLSGRRED